MLVLSRQKDESIILICEGKIIAKIQAVTIGENRVILGITAPKIISIKREEVWDKEQKEKKREKKHLVSKTKKIL